MQQKYYLDTCIWRDYFENRSDNLRPLGEWAFMLIKKIIKNEDLIVYSRKVEEELLECCSLSELSQHISIIPNKLLLKVELSEIQFREAHSLSRRILIPLGDAIHFILSRDNIAILVSRDSHLLGLPGIIVKKPEELL